MRRDEDLLYKLLLQAEGEDPKPDMSTYTEDQMAYHAAILIDSGLVRGETVQDHSGQVRAAVILDLTPEGHDFLKIKRSRFNSQIPIENSPIDIFVSHCQIDEQLASALIELLIDALDIPRRAIRCTSVDGHKLNGGDSIESKIRKEINQSKLFIGLLTPSSLNSTYVMFELGARWGAQKNWYLVKAKGLQVQDLRGPLPAYNVTDAKSESDLASMIENFSRELSIIPQNLATLQSKIRTVIHAAEPINTKTDAHDWDKTPVSEDILEDEDILIQLTAWINKNLYSLDNWVIIFSELDSELGLPKGSCAKHLENLVTGAGAKLIRRGSKSVLFESPDESRGTW